MEVVPVSKNHATVLKLWTPWVAPSAFSRVASRVPCDNSLPLVGYSHFPSTDQYKGLKVS